MNTNISRKISCQAASMTLEDAYQTLQDTLSNISSSKAWTEYLYFQFRFHNYSFHNILLIKSQNPSATFIA